MNFDSTTTLLVVGAAIAILLLLWAVLRAVARVSIAKQARDRAGEPYVANKERPYVKAATPPPTMSPPLANEPDVAQPAVPAVEVLAGMAFPPRSTDSGDELTRLKGVGPKLAAMLNEQGITRYEQLASMDDAQLAALDARLGNFKGRLARDRVPEQARYLASGDTAGFEATFGKLGG
jgi:predicted flap endonuclease-1-like 5' DNA nuclease